MTLIAEIGGIPPAIIDYPVTVRDLQERHPLIAWPDPPTAAAFDDTDFEGHWYAVVEPTPQPDLAWGERAVEAAPINDAGTWRQVWTIESITLAEAKTQLRFMARGILEERVERLSSVEHELFGELGRLLAAQDAGAAINQANYRLVQAIAAARGVTFTNAAAFANAFRSAWLNRADDFVGKYMDVLDRVQAIQDGPTAIAQARSIYLELEVIP